MLKLEQRKQKMIARAISASFLVQTCAFPAVHAFAADEVVATPVSNTSKETPKPSVATTTPPAQAGAEEKAQQKVATINLKESEKNSFKDKSDSELWAALGITRDEYDKVSMSEFKNYIEKRHANDETYQNSRKEKKDSYDLVMTEAETEMLNRKNNSFSWKAENAKSKINGYFIEKKSDDSTKPSAFKEGGTAVKHAFENWDTLSDAQKEVAAMTAVQMGYQGKVTSDSDKFKAVENLKQVIASYTKDHTAVNVYEAVTDFMKSNGIDFDEVLKKANKAQQQVNQTSDDSKVTNGAEEKKKPCPTGYKHDEVNNVCCAEDTTYDKFQGKCKKEIKAENVCNAGFEFDSYANKCCPTGSSYDLVKGACVIKGKEEQPQEPRGGGKNKQLLGLLAGILMNNKGGKSSDAKNSDRGGIEPITERGEKITAEKAQKILSVPFDFRFSYGSDSTQVIDDPASQKYFGEPDKSGNIIVAGSNSDDRINITIHDRGDIERINKSVQKTMKKLNAQRKKNKQPLIPESDYPQVKIALRIFNTEAIDNGVLDDTEKKWFAPYQALSSFEGATNGMAQFEISLDQPSMVVPKGMKRPAGDFKIYVVYKIPEFDQKNQVYRYQERIFEVGYRVYNTHTSLSPSEYSKNSQEALGVAKVAEDYGQVEASGVIESASWNSDGTCTVRFSGNVSDEQQSSEVKGVKVRSRSMSKEECESSQGKKASFGKLTYSHDASATDDDKALVDYDYDENNNPVSLGGAVTIGDKVVSDGNYALDDVYSNSVNKGKRISSRKIDPENLDYLTVGGTPLAYNSTTKEFYNYDGTPLSSGQKKSIASALGTKYWDEWNHIGLDVTSNPDGTYTLTKTDGTTMTGTKLDENMISDLQKSSENVRGDVLRELADDRRTIADHYTNWDTMTKVNGQNPYSYLLSNPQSKLHGDKVAEAYSVLGINSTAKDYLVSGLSTAFDMSGSPSAKVDKRAERKAKRDAEKAERERVKEEARSQSQESRTASQSINTLTNGTAGENVSNIETKTSPNANNSLVAPHDSAVRFVSPPTSQQEVKKSSPSDVAPETVVYTQGISKPVENEPKETVIKPQHRMYDMNGNEITHPIYDKAGNEINNDYFQQKRREAFQAKIQQSQESKK